MATRYSETIMQFPTKGIVMEDNIWEYGKPKKKAKVNIPAMMPLQDPAETTVVTKKKSNKGIIDKSVDKTVNYVEIYLPDSVYTYPTESELENEEPEIIGASKKNPKRTEENGETKTGLARIVKKNTRLIVLVIDGIAIADNIKVIAKFDDYEEEKLMKAAEFGGSISELTRESALR